MSVQPWDYHEGNGDLSPRATVVQVESLGKGAWAIVTAAIVLSALALAVSWSAGRSSALAERETRIMRDEIDRMKVELDINTNH